MPRVIRIEPTVDIRTHTSISSIKKRRVCEPIMNGNMSAFTPMKV